MKTIAAALLAALALAGCEKAVRNMYEGSRLKPLAPSKQFDDGAAERQPVQGTVAHARGVLAGTSSARTGAEGEVAVPPALTLALLQRGRERYDIHCAPCHSPLGDGDGIVARRGFPHPPSFHLDRLRAAPDRHFYDVIAEGYGVMHAHGDRIAREDRWAIVAYIRALQLSQHPR